MENEENQKAGFPVVSHRSWKSLRDSHIPTAPTTVFNDKSKPKKGDRLPA